MAVACASHGAAARGSGHWSGWVLATRAGRFGGSGARQERQSEEVVEAAAAEARRWLMAVAPSLLCHAPG